MFILKVELLSGFLNLFVDIKANIMVINFTLNIIPEDLLAIKRKRKSKLRDISSTYLCITFSVFSCKIVIFPEKKSESIIKSIILIGK